MSETTKDIIKDILENDGMCISPTSLFDFDEDGGILLGDLAERIKVAHEREFVEKDAEIARLRECLREAVEWSCGNPDESCEDCVAHGGDTPCKCEKWRKALEGGKK